MTIKEVATKGHDNAVKHGFYFQDSEQAIKDKLDEEIEEFKTAIYCKDFKSFPKDMLNMNDESFQFAFNRFIKDTVGAELADIVVTALSGAVELGIPIELFIEAVQRNNTLRRY